MSAPAPETFAPRVLRRYQVEAVQAVIDAWADGEHRVGVVLPTGSGKSTVIAALAVQAHRLGLQVVMLAHRGELLNQMADAVHAVDPTIKRVGIVRAEQDDHDSPIVAATLQTLVNASRREALGPRQVILWDEVHHIGAEGWHNVLVELGGYEGAWVCGFTATMRRETGRKLGESIERVVYERDLRWAIDNGFLVKPHGLTVKIPDLNLDQVRTTAGDFNQGELAEVMEASTESVVDAITKYAADRHPIIFAASVVAADMIAAALTASGFPAEATTGAMGMDEREVIYGMYRRREIKALVTVMVLTEGADFPMCDAVIIARPTQSQVLYSQMVGRALRLYDDKEDALVLDLAGTSRVLGLVTLTDLDAGLAKKTVDEDGEIIEDEPGAIPNEEAALPAEKQRREGPLDLVSIDLLNSGSTGVLWLETVGGIPFCPSGVDDMTFLWNMGNDQWQAGWMNMKGQKQGDWIQSSPSDLPDAIGAAEDWIIDRHGKLPLRKAGWRANQPPSEKQVNFARMLGIPDSEHKTKARLSDDISVHLASKRLDKV